MRFPSAETLTILVKNRNDIGTAPPPESIDVNARQCSNGCPRPPKSRPYAVAAVKGFDRLCVLRLQLLRERTLVAGTPTRTLTGPTEVFCRP